MADHTRNGSGGIRVAGVILVLVGLAFAVYGSRFFDGWLMHRQEDPNHDATLKLVFGVVSWIIAVVIVGFGVAMKPWKREGKSGKPGA